MSDKLIRASVACITPLTDSILHVTLAPEEYIDYQAGQYLQISIGTELLSYSIANAPLGSRKYELHIRHANDSSNNQLLLTEIKNKGYLMIKVPLGNCDISKLHPDKPILFIAGGTGFAPINAMIEQLLVDGKPRRFELYWGARSHSDLYMDEKVSYWHTHVDCFQYFSHVSDITTMTLSSVVIQRHRKDLNEWQIVISGPFDMVYNTRDQLVANGALPMNLFSDAFSFEGSK